MVGRTPQLRSVFLMGCCDSAKLERQSTYYQRSNEQDLFSRCFPPGCRLLLPGAASGDDEFDAAFIGDGRYGHIPERARRVAFLHAITGQLKRGAPVVLTVSLRAGGGRFCAAASNLLRRILQNEPTVEPGDTMGAGFEHHFLPDELIGELMAGGLTSVEIRRTPVLHAAARVR